MPPRKSYKDVKKNVPYKFRRKDIFYTLSDRKYKLEAAQKLKKFLKKNGFYVSVVKEGKAYKVYQGEKFGKLRSKKDIRDDITELNQKIGWYQSLPEDFNPSMKDHEAYRKMLIKSSELEKELKRN